MGSHRHSLRLQGSGVTTARPAEDLSIHWSGRTFFDFQHTSRRRSLQLTCGLPPNRRWKAGSGFGCTPLLKFQHTSAYHQVLRNVENPPRQLENSKKHGFRFSDFLGQQTPWELQYYHCSNFNGFFRAKKTGKTHGMPVWTWYRSARHRDPPLHLAVSDVRYLSLPYKRR